MPTSGGPPPDGDHQRHGRAPSAAPKPHAAPAGHAGPPLGGRRRRSHRRGDPFARHRQRVAGGTADLELEAVGVVAQGPRGRGAAGVAGDRHARRSGTPSARRCPAARAARPGRPAAWRRAGRRARRASAAARGAVAAQRTRAARASRSATARRARSILAEVAAIPRVQRPARSSSGCATRADRVQFAGQPLALDRDRQLGGPLTLALEFARARLGGERRSARVQRATSRSRTQAARWDEEGGAAEQR